MCLRKTIAGKVDKKKEKKLQADSDWLKFCAFRYPIGYLILERNSQCQQAFHKHLYYNLVYKLFYI